MIAMRKRRLLGFTLIELMIVMAVIAVLMSVAIPIYTRSITRSKESVLKNNLFTLRTVIDEYTTDWTDKVDGKVTSHGKKIISKDGKTLTVTVEGSSQMLIYDRQ